MKSFVLYLLTSLFYFFLYSSVLAQQLTLQVNYKKAVKIFKDEPVLLTLSIVNKEAQENQRWNNAGNRRLHELDELLRTNKISREEYDKEKQEIINSKKKVQPLSIGSIDKPWHSIIHWKLLNETNGKEYSITIRALPNPGSAPVAVLDEKGFYKVWFGINAAEWKMLPAGKYNLAATLYDKSSGFVQIEVMEANMPVAVVESEEMMLRSGKYHWHTGDAANGMIYAERLLKKNSASLEGYSLRADLFVLQQKFSEALNDYQAALKLFYKEYPGVSEPPEYLLEMIAWVKAELEK